MASWAINGTPLDTEFVTVVVTPNSLGLSETMRRQDIPILHDTMRSHLLGRNLPVWKVKFEFVGPSPQRYTQLLIIRNLIRGNATWSLESPLDSEVVFEDGDREIDLSLVRLRVDYLEGLDSVVMEVEALHVNPDLTSGLFDALIGCTSLTETGFTINEAVFIHEGFVLTLAPEILGRAEAVTAVQGTELLIAAETVDTNENVEPLTGEEKSGTESFGKAESVTVVNT